MYRMRPLGVHLSLKSWTLWSTREGGKRVHVRRGHSISVLRWKIQNWETDPFSVFRFGIGKMLVPLESIVKVFGEVYPPTFSLTSSPTSMSAVVCRLFHTCIRAQTPFWSVLTADLVHLRLRTAAAELQVGAARGARQARRAPGSLGAQQQRPTADRLHARAQPPEVQRARRPQAEVGVAALAAPESPQTRGCSRPPARSGSAAPPSTA